MTIVAHRCGTDLFPESTLAAARHSLALGADYLEIDIRFTRDGIPVISHDADLRRLFGDEEKICKLSAEDFHSRRHIARPDFGPAFLEEFFDAGLGSLLFHVKEGGASLEKLISAVERRDYGSKVVFGVCSVRDAHILKSEMAALLCKERAVFMPTGTLANHLAIRALAQRGDRVLVQEQSHMYQD